MELISSINNSGIGAQYAVSAAKDVNGNEITSTYLTAVPEGYATESFVTSQGYITGSYLTADALDNVSSTWNTVTDKLNTTAFSTVSASFLTAHQSLPNSANWNDTYNTVNGNSATWNSTYDTVHDNSASWSGSEVSVTSPRGTINVNGDQIEGTNSAVITGTAGGYVEYLLTANNHIDTTPAALTNGTLETMQTGGTLVIPVQGGDPSLYITVTGETTGGGTATASGQGSAGISNFIYIPLGEMSGPFSAQSTYWVNISDWLLTASAAPTTGIIGVGELAWNSAITPIRNASAAWQSTYNTVAVNSASWGAGSTYTGDAQGALDEVYTNSGDWNTVTDKLDSSAFSTVSGSFITAHQDLTGSANWDSTYTTVSDNSATWATVTDKLDATAQVVTSVTTGKVSSTGVSAINSTPIISTAVNNAGKMLVGSSDPGMYLTGTHGTAYYKANELIINRTGYGEQIKFNLGSAGSQVIGSAAGNRGAFINMFNDSHTAFVGVLSGEDAAIVLDGASATPNSITSWNGVVSTVSDNSASWGGSDVPEGVMVESGLEYNAVNEISGYNGSAIAQYGAEKQWLVHDDTLVHASNSAQYALGVNLSAVAQLLGIDETVLWSGTYGSTTLSLSESPLNFNSIKVYYGGHNNNTSGQNSYYGCTEFEPVINGTTAQYMPINSTFIGNLATNTMYEVYTMWSGVNTTEWERIYYGWKNITGTSWNTGSNWQSVYKVIGIGRKQ